MIAYAPPSPEPTLLLQKQHKATPDEAIKEKKISVVKDSLWTKRFVIRLLGFIVSQYVFLPSIGHVRQSKTPGPACARGRCDKVQGTITGARSVRAD